MTIEMVAMLFDFIFETKDLPDGIKALLARLQIPVLKAAMLDGAFFAKKSHPSRLLVNELAQAGLGWSPAMGQEDPLYRKIDEIVHQILDNFSDDLAIFDEQREDLEAFLAEEEKAAEAEHPVDAPRRSTRGTASRSRSVVAKAEIEKRIEASPVPNFLASFLRQQWQGDARARLSRRGRGKRGLGVAASPRSRTSCGACSRSARPRTAGTSSRCCRRC